MTYSHNQPIEIIAAKHFHNDLKEGQKGRVITMRDRLDIDLDYIRTFKNGKIFKTTILEFWSEKQEKFIAQIVPAGMEEKYIKII